MILEKWEKASNEGVEIITMGDTNLNYMRWDISPALMNSYDRCKKTNDTSSKGPNS